MQGTSPDPRQVTSREELARFVQALHKDPTAQGDPWQNPSLDRFLDAFARWLASADHWAANMRRFAPSLAIDVESPSWQRMAAALRATCVYE